MTTLLYSHAGCFGHNPGAHHPERPARLEAVLEALDDPRFAALDRREAPLADLADLERVHPRPFIDALLAAVPKHGVVGVDGDTLLSPGSGEAALRAAGAVCAAVDAVVAGEATNAFCAVRPPGHHAERSQAMGFCLFNSVAVAARHARAVHGFARVAVVGFDVHHGNGTQFDFEDEPGLFYGSTHQAPLYPGTGMSDEVGVGNIVNVPLRPYSGSADFRAAISNTILPRLAAFGPELLLISAGFDAHRSDPLANLELDEADFTWVTQQLTGFAARTCGGRVVSSLEGGYDLDALASSVAAHVAALMAA